MSEEKKVHPTAIPSTSTEEVSRQEQEPLLAGPQRYSLQKQPSKVQTGNRIDYHPLTYYRVLRNSIFHVFIPNGNLWRSNCFKSLC